MSQRTHEDHWGLPAAGETFWYTVVASRGINAVRVFEVEATDADEARMMIERDLAGTWEWDTIQATEMGDCPDCDGTGLADGIGDRAGIYGSDNCGACGGSGLMTGAAS